jgi:hypothetical protein
MTNIYLFFLLIISFESTAYGFAITEQLNNDNSMRTCEKLFGSSPGGPITSILASIKSISVFYDDHYIHNIWF